MRWRGQGDRPPPEATVAGTAAGSVRVYSHETRSACCVIVDHQPKPITILARGASSRTTASTRTIRSSAAAYASRATQPRQQPTSPAGSANHNEASPPAADGYGG